MLFCKFTCCILELIVLGPPQDGEIFWGGGWTPSQNMQFEAAAKLSFLCCHLATASEEDSFTFYWITLVFIKYYYCSGWCCYYWRVEDAYEREFRERRERREREQREREQREKLTTTASDKPIELTDKEKELEQMKVCVQLWWQESKLLFVSHFTEGRRLSQELETWHSTLNMLTVAVSKDFHIFYAAVLPRRRPHHVLILSICLSVCLIPLPRGKTKRPTNTKLGEKGPWDTSTPWTNFKVKGSEVKVTAANCVVGKKSL